MVHILLICYDIPDDDRRTAISNLLAVHGARVQLSVFEIALPTKKEVRSLRSSLRRLIDKDTDQVRIYPLSPIAANEMVILGRRRLEERADFWIV
ncbi:CRISPR-associated endonuclease Cas2 [Promicromonospora alba]|uniref:CRISPR-associated endoribonuclease Cas2 n=1 Tax=Promicromonospora alba TaxID=1616110 RepID=A0ABV9HCE8_9MICO